MGFPGTWMTLSESMVYRVVPKCACSTIGQIMYFSDHGKFYEGDIHDAQEGLHKWAQDGSQDLIRLRFGPLAAIISGFVLSPNSERQTCCRCSRVLSRKMALSTVHQNPLS